MASLLRNVPLLTHPHTRSLTPAHARTRPHTPAHTHTHTSIKVKNCIAQFEAVASHPNVSFFGNTPIGNKHQDKQHNTISVRISICLTGWQLFSFFTPPMHPLSCLPPPNTHTYTHPYTAANSRQPPCLLSFLFSGFFFLCRGLLRLAFSSSRSLRCCGAVVRNKPGETAWHPWGTTAERRVCT